MSSYPALVFALISSLIVNCSGKNITAYIKEALTTTKCESVNRIPSVCNVDWKITKVAVKDYDENIKTVNESISSGSIVFGLNSSEARSCRKAYENMLCKNYFPVCDSKNMLIDYGNGTERCETVRKVCTTIDVQGCEYSANGEQSIVLSEKKCVPLLSNTTKFCPNFKMKVPSGYALFADKYIKHLSEAAEMFERQTKYLTGMESCLKNFNEVLCRLIDACSSDGYYSLHLISKEECEDKMSCIKNSDGLLNVDTSICTMLPNAASLEEFVIEDPFQEESTVSTPVVEGETESLVQTKMSLKEYKKNEPTGEAKTTSSNEPTGEAKTTSNNGTTGEAKTTSDLSLAVRKGYDETLWVPTAAGNRNHHLVWFTFILSTVPSLLLFVAL